MDYDKIISKEITAVSVMNKHAELFSSKLNLFPQNILGSTILTTLDKFSKAFDTMNIAKNFAIVPQPNVDFAALTAVHSTNLAIANIMKPDSLAMVIGGMNNSSWMDSINKFSANITAVPDAIKELMIAGSRPFQVELGISKLHDFKVGSTLVDTFAIQTALTKVSAYTFQAEKTLLNVNVGSIGSMIGLNETQRLIVAGSFSDLSASYKSMFSLFETNPAAITQVNPFLFKSVPASFLNSANLIEAISVDIQEEVEEEELMDGIYSESNIYSLLSGVNPDLKELWYGANAAIDSKQPDSIRHFATSTRELFTQILHSLAPDKKVEAWDKDPELYYDGRPTREARLLYICREINENSMKDFIKKDVSSIIAVVKLFNEQTHKIKSDLSPKQIIALKVKTETTLKYLIQVGQA